MDDFAIPIEADTPGGLLCLLQGAAEALGALARDVGMCAIAIVVLRGRGFADAQQRLGYDGDKIGRLRLANGSDLRVVPTYRHLGVTTGARDHIGAEAMQRVLAANGARHALGRVILADRRLAFDTRVMVARTRIKTRLLFATGTWNDVSPVSMRQLAGTWAAALRRVVLQHRPPRPDEHLASDAEIRLLCEEAPMARQMAVARLRYLGRVVR